MKRILLSGVCLAIIAPAFTQPPPVGTVTVSFQPDDVIGEDATILELHDNSDKDCTPWGSSQPPSGLNFGSNTEVNFSAWTYNEGGCPEGTARELIRFTQLNTIPSDASIASATLILRGPSPTLAWGNNLFPGTPLPNDNSGWVKRVLPGAANAWDENTVTWNTQPATDATASNWAPIPVTGQRWGWTQSIDVTTLVTNIVQELSTNPDANNGFMLMLQDETFYRAQCYASSDHADSRLWPELVVTYSDCHSGFSYCVSSTQTSIYDFTAANPALVSYTWTVDGSYAGSGSTLNYDFGYSWLGSTSHTVCLKGLGTDGYECERCLEVCGSSYIKYNTPAPCIPTFTFCTQTPNNQNYTFTADDLSMAGYTWKINGSPVGYGPTLSYSFPTIGDYELELEVTNGGTSCFSYVKNFCVSPVYLYGEGSMTYETRPAEAPQQGKMIRGDDPVLQVFPGQVIISPNPAESGWNVDYSLTEPDEVTITLLDLSGKQVKSITEKGNKGNNHYYMPASDIAAGMYLIEMKGKYINAAQKAVRQ